MKITLFLIVCAVFLGCTSRGFAQEKKASGFWKNVEVGTNLIPMVDSLTLQPSNLQLKYYYGKHHDNAFRVNLFFNDIYLEDVKSHSPKYLSDVSIQIGHLWYKQFKPKLDLFCAIDFKFSNNSNNIFPNKSTNEVSYIFHRFNKYYFYLSGGIKYNVYKNLSLELETSTSIALQRYYSNSTETDNVENVNSFYSNVFHWNYYPINCLTINYQF